ncbi:hypothetical protein [Proteus columbae]|uniref:hypothetical protein n=1 Tax=Proteus columbae TaxID=1987580 RepID=UPI0013000812|nr:hypothetical protein [Proteus columbae]
MGSPYGGAIFVGSIDLIRITLESKDEKIIKSTKSPIINLNLKTQKHHNYTIFYNDSNIH